MHGVVVNTLTDTRTGGAIMWVGGDGLMALVMIAIGRRWLRSAELRARDRRGVMEITRQAVFAERTGGTPNPTPGTEFDEDDAAHEKYNAWLAGLEERQQTGHRG